MPTEESMERCSKCGRRTMHVARKPNHILHLLLTVFTAGIWLIPWLLLSLGQKPAQCTECGKRRGPFGLW